MNEYRIVERGVMGFSNTWTIKAKSLTSAKRQASIKQTCVNTCLYIYEEVAGELINIATRGPLERADSKWETA